MIMVVVVVVIVVVFLSTIKHHLVSLAMHSYVLSLPTDFVCH